ncbi:MAG: TlpA family protein disulfide reductase [Methanomassiliicoccaceae archaeon]|nr:TlpA family protein disulfide reductase [Methanomassiliicoccaceae archaeon]MCL2145620.1 TlpA family protein disulfide reductase [Methanomassiliicoccaceae archaeon]
MNKKVIIAVLAILIIGAVLAAAYFVLSDNEKNEPEFTEEELIAFGVTVYDEEMRIVLHDVTTLEGVPFDSGDIPKKYVLLTFWATWCPDCDVENPSLQRLYDERADDKFTVLTISIDTSLSAVKNYLEDNEYDFPVLINLKNNLWEEYFPTIPTSFLLNPDGKVIAKIVDSTDWDSEEASRILDYLMSLS